MEEIINRIRVYLVENIEWELVVQAGLRILIILVVFAIVSRIFRSFLKEVEKRWITQGIVEGEPPSESHKRVETITRLVRQGVMLTLWITVVLMMLKQIGMDVGPIIASAGIVGVAVGFGSQNLVRDVISGFFIILENQIRVGDVAIINGTGGLVEKIRFRTTVLRDLGGVVHVFPNGTISSLSNMTNEWSAYVFDIGVAYKEQTDRVISLMDQVGQDLFTDTKFSKSMLEKPEIFGVDKLADSSVVIKGRIRTKPIKQWEVGREYLRRVKMCFDREGIEIPFPHRTLYMGDESKPFDVLMKEGSGTTTGENTD
jgi:small conductance mechanosensitive channel